MAKTQPATGTLADNFTWASSPRILTLLNKDYHRGKFIIPMKDCFLYEQSLIGKLVGGTIIPMKDC